MDTSNHIGEFIILFVMVIVPFFLYRTWRNKKNEKIKSRSVINENLHNEHQT